MATTAPEVIVSEGSFAKLEKGENRFRILSDIVSGFEYWKETTDGKKVPVRSKSPVDMDFSDVPPREKVRNFWIFAVWKDERVQVLEVTQKSIQKAISSFINDEDFGDTLGYDIVVNRTGDGLDTEYTILAKPPKKMDEDATTAWAETLEAGFSLDAIFTSGNPFKPEEKNELDEMLDAPKKEVDDEIDVESLFKDEEKN